MLSRVDISTIMDHNKIQFSDKYLKVKEKLTLLEKKNNIFSTIPCSPNDRNLVIEIMTFRFKNFLRTHGIKYSYYRDWPGKVIVNQPNFPRLIFEFDEMSYVKIRRITHDNWEFNLLIYSEKELIIKMLRLNLLNIQTIKRMYSERKKLSKKLEPI